MKLHPDQSDGLNVIQSFDGKALLINGRMWQHSILLPAVGEVQLWPVEDFSKLTASHFEAVARLSPELVILGSGPNMRFPHPSWIRPLIDQGIGVESMSTAAACRTYNVLASEKRRVIAALVLLGNTPQVTRSD